MELSLNTEEVADIINAVENEIEDARDTLKCLTEPDERYEYNDIQLYIARLVALVNKLKSIPIGG